LPVTPKFKVSGTARYEMPVGPGKAHIQSNITYSSSASSSLRIGTATDTPPPTLASYTLVDLAIGYDWNKITTELFVSNLFDKRAQISSFEQCGACSQRDYFVVYPPRTVGVKLGYKF
jgi:outer membrane receptor protein involved in Fe transport